MRGLLVAIDRSKGRRTTIYSIVASKVKHKNTLMRCVDTFKHVKDLSRRERTTYFPKALGVIERLVGYSILHCIEVTDDLSTLLHYVETLSEEVLVAVIDDCLVKAVRAKLCGSVTITEGSLRRHKVTLRSLDLKPSIMHALISIADTLSAYVRIQVERFGRDVKSVRTKLPLRWRYKLDPPQPHPLGPPPRDLAVEGFIHYFY